MFPAQFNRGTPASAPRPLDSTVSHRDTKATTHRNQHLDIGTSGARSHRLRDP